MRLKLFFLSCLVLGGFWLMAGQAQALSCATPANLQVMVNKTTGEAYVQWSSVLGAVTYYIEVYTDQNPIQPIKSYKVGGNLTSFTIPDADLACGNYKYRVKAECCEDRCDKCDGKFDPKKDYCSNMATLWEDPSGCGCSDPNFPGTVNYSFNFTCSDGSKAGYLCADGSLPAAGFCDDKSMPRFRNCPLGTEVLGCNWECTRKEVYMPKACGVEYEVACGKPPHETIVSSQPTYNLCFLKDPFGWKPKDSLVLPPGVTEQQPPLLYQWRCASGAKIGEQCFACRRSVCGSPQGKTYSGDLPTDKLCLDADGTLTGEPTVTPTDEGWVWTCRGQQGCGSNNNWVKYWNGETKDPTPNAWKQLETCWALKAACGQADGQFYTHDNFVDKELTTKNFLCKGQGKAMSSTPGQRYDEAFLFDENEKNFGKIISHSMVWKCLYDQGTPQETELDCSAHIVGCRTDIIGKNYTKDSFDSLQAASPPPANLCYNGINNSATPDQVSLGAITETDNPFGWEWTCSDPNGGMDKCQANLVDCKKPPHDSDYQNEQAVMADAPLCTAGEATQLRDWMSGTPPEQLGWNWDCFDDLDNSVTCQANLLRCKAPPDGETYGSWKEFRDPELGGAKCGEPVKDKAKCKNVCSDLTKEVEVTYNPDTKQWIWHCGDTECKAAKDTCIGEKELPRNGYYADLNELAKDQETRGYKCDITNGAYSCQGLCNNKDKFVAIKHDTSDGHNRFYWQCGDEECEAKEMGCGKLVGKNSPMTKATFDKYANNEKVPFGSPDFPYSQDFSLCMNGGTPVWYDKAGVSNSIGVGWTDYWAGEFSNPLWTPFDDHDNPPPASPPRSYLANEFKGGAPLWRCDYGGKSVPTATGDYVYEQDKTFYCYAWEQGVCADVLVALASGEEDPKSGDNQAGNKNKYTLNEIRAMATDANHRGNPDLCARGIVFDAPYGFEGYDPKYLIDNRFVCGGPNDPDNPNDDLGYDSCIYKCEGGMNKHGAADVACQALDVAACRKFVNIAPDYKGPHLGTYADQTAFEAAWNTPPLNGSQTGGCEKGDATQGPVFNEATCQWQWNCDDELKAGDRGYFQCHANKQLLPLTAAIVPSSLPKACATDETPQSLTADTNCDNIDYIRWTASVNGQPIPPKIVANGENFSFTAKSLYESLGRVSGLYSISYHVVCKDNCLESKEADAKPLTFTIDMGDKQKASFTDDDDDNTICVDDSITFTATKDPNCQDATYTWTGCTPAFPNASTCTKTYTERRTYPAGDVGVKITCSNCYEDYLGQSPAITVNKTNDPIGVAIEPPTMDTCEDNPDPQIFTARPTYDDSFSLDNCANVKYTWTIDGQAKFTETNGLNVSRFDLSELDPKLAAGSYLVGVTAQCQDECSKKTSSSASANLTIKKASTQDVEVKGFPTADKCQGEAGIITGTAITDCSSFIFSFKVVDANGQGFEGETDPLNPKIKTIDTSKLGLGTYHLEYSLDCTDPNVCVKPPDPLEVIGADTFDVTLGFETPNANFNGATDEFCQGSSDPATVNLVYSLPQTDCSKLKHEWQVDNGAWGGPDSPTYPTNNLAVGAHHLAVRVTCLEDCATKPNPALAEFDINIYDCVCGSANGKKFVGGADNKLSQADITNNSDPSKSFRFCKDDCVPVPDLPFPLETLSDGESGWKWYCKCGSGGGNLRSPDCLAKKTMCGSASGSGLVYTKDSWTSLTVSSTSTASCLNGAMKNYLETYGSNVKANNACVDDVIKDTREWTCEDSAGHTTLTCDNKILDCGIAEATRILNNPAANCDRRVRPYDDRNNSYAGSYTAAPPKEHLCTLLPYDKALIDTNRGKWYWECGNDSLGADLRCEARVDCNWAGDYEYATVQYGGAGCWTAENVKDATGGASFNWGVATDISTYQGCKKFHCQLTSEDPTDGICPAGYTVPKQSLWHRLESQLSTSTCDEDRLINTGACAPAGNGNVSSGPNGWQQDGLKDQVTFAGVSGQNYWTSDTSRPGSPLCNFNSGTCRPCLGTLYYYGLDAGSQVKLGSDIAGSGINNCSDPAHQLRCVNKESIQGVLPPTPPKGWQCYGWTCVIL